MARTKLTLDQLTEEITAGWTEEDWNKWYSENQEKETFFVNKLKIRPCHPNDLEVMHLSQIVPSETFEGTEALRGDYKGNPVAYVEYELLGDSTVHILKIAVDDSYRREGFAVEMLCEVRKHGDCLIANVARGNEPSLALFRGFGFRDHRSKGEYLELVYGYNSETQSF